MIATLGTLEEAAKELVGNWLQFDCFSWDRSQRTRRCGSILSCIHATIGTANWPNSRTPKRFAEAMAPVPGPETLRCVRGTPRPLGSRLVSMALRFVSIAVAESPRAFRTYHELQQRLADYPVLDEDDYSHRVYEATLENIADSAWRLKREYDLPSDWAFQTYRWLSDHDCSEIENDDDRGGYPSELWLRRAFDGLGFKRGCL